jgi:hypothetical protein
MKLIILISLLSLTSCKWLNDRAISGWTEGTADLLLEMSLRKSMINDTPLKTMEALEAPGDIKLNQKDLCRCATKLYGGILTVIANDVKASSVKGLCSGMNRCFFKSKAPEVFFPACIKYIEKGPFKKLARDRRTSIQRFTKARRHLSSHCSKL